MSRVLLFYDEVFEIQGMKKYPKVDMSTIEAQSKLVYISYGLTEEEVAIMERQTYDG